MDLFVGNEKEKRNIIIIIIIIEKKHYYFFKKDKGPGCEKALLLAHQNPRVAHLFTDLHRWQLPFFIVVQLLTIVFSINVHRASIHCPTQTLSQSFHHLPVASLLLTLAVKLFTPTGLCSPTVLCFYVLGWLVRLEVFLWNHSHD